jgi:ABC-type cobalamin transport system permease subunit
MWRIRKPTTTAVRAMACVAAVLAATGGFSQTPEAANAAAPAAASGVSSGASLAPPPGVLIPPGKAPEVSLLYTGDVIGFIEPCG